MKQRTIRLGMEEFETLLGSGGPMGDVGDAERALWSTLIRALLDEDGWRDVTVADWNGGEEALIEIAAGPLPERPLRRVSGRMGFESLPARRLRGDGDRRQMQ